MLRIDWKAMCTKAGITIPCSRRKSGPNAEFEIARYLVNGAVNFVFFASIALLIAAERPLPVRNCSSVSSSYFLCPSFPTSAISYCMWKLPWMMRWVS